MIDIARGPNRDNWVYDLERHTGTRLTFGGIQVDPVWTPDGEHVAYSKQTDGAYRIVQSRADGTGSADLLLPDVEKDQLLPSWSRDGELLAFTVLSSRNRLRHLDKAAWTGGGTLSRISVQRGVGTFFTGRPLPGLCVG